MHILPKWLRIFLKAIAIIFNTIVITAFLWYSYLGSINNGKFNGIYGHYFSYNLDESAEVNRFKFCQLESEVFSAKILMLINGENASKFDGFENYKKVHYELHEELKGTDIFVVNSNNEKIPISHTKDGPVHGYRFYSANPIPPGMYDVFIYLPKAEHQGYLGDISLRFIKIYPGGKMGDRVKRRKTPNCPASESSNL